MVNKEKRKKLQQILADVDENTREIAEGSINEFLFLEDTLQKLRLDIEMNGPTMLLTNGNGIESLKENPALKAYNATMRSYATVIGSLKKLLPKIEAIDDFDEF